MHEEYGRRRALKVTFFWLHREACGILVPQPGIKPMFPAVETQGLNHWEVPKVHFYNRDNMTFNNLNKKFSHTCFLGFQNTFPYQFYMTHTLS